MGSGMFDGLLTGILFLSAIIGVFFGGFIFVVIPYLCHHVSIGWTP